MGKLLVSHRYDSLSLLPSDPGEVQEELVVQDLPTGAKVVIFQLTASFRVHLGEDGGGEIR